MLLEINLRILKHILPNSYNSHKIQLFMKLECKQGLRLMILICNTNVILDMPQKAS